MAEQTDPRMQRAIDVIIRMQKFDEFPAAAVESFMPYLRKDAEMLLAEIDGPEPTWRDVIREFLKLGPYLLERRTTDGNRYWRYEINQRTKGGLREIVDTLHFPTESTWIVKLGLYGPHQVTLRNPTPAEVLAAARLVGLGGGNE